MNPVAGFTDPELFRQRIKRIIARHNCEYTIHETREGDCLEPVIRKATEEGFQVFIAAGGDGTISEVASCLAYTDIPLGIMPSGTGNALAKTLGLPQDLGAALRLILGKHEIRQLDAVRVFEQYHVLNVGVGVTSAVVKQTTRPIKRRLGIFAYIYEAFKVLIGIQPYSFKLTIDGRKYHFRASEIFIACGGWLGIQLPFSDLKILPDDGQVDVFVIKARNFWGYLTLAVDILFGKPDRAPQMRYFPARQEIYIETRKILPVQSDGDWIGETPVKIDICPQAVNIIVPHKDDEPLINRWRRLVGWQE